MKALVLLLLRVSTGLLLIIWGVIKASNPEASIGVSDTYYGGVLSAENFQTPLGIAQILLGALVILGLFRQIVYPLQAIVLGLGAAAIWKYLADPLGLYLVEDIGYRTLFFPSTTVFFASLALLAFKDDDNFSLGAAFGR